MQGSKKQMQVQGLKNIDAGSSEMLGRDSTQLRRITADIEKKAERSGKCVKGQITLSSPDGKAQVTLIAR